MTYNHNLKMVKHIKKDACGLPVNFWSKASKAFEVNGHNIKGTTKVGISWMCADMLCRLADEAVKATRHAKRVTVQERDVYTAASLMGWEGRAEAMGAKPTFTFGQAHFKTALKSQGAGAVGVSAVYAMNVVLEDVLKTLSKNLILKKSETVKPCDLRAACKVTGLDAMLPGDWAQGGVEEYIEEALLKPCKPKRKARAPGTRKTKGGAKKTSHKKRASKKRASKRNSRK